MENVLTPLVSRYPNERQILGWVLMNEPYLAMRPGYLSPDAFASFVSEAATVVKQRTNRQPVSAAFDSLESLVTAGQASDVLAHLDFFLFHHYQHDRYDDHLPVPAAHLRTLLPSSTKADAKPIYIGEFDTQRAAQPFDPLEFARWSTTLGYDGVWPWRLNTQRGPQTERGVRHQPDPLQVGSGLSSIMEIARVASGRDQLPDFANRRTSGVRRRDSVSVARWVDWLQHGRALAKAYEPEASRMKGNRDALKDEDVALRKVIDDKDRELDREVKLCLDENKSDLAEHRRYAEKESAEASRQAVLVEKTRTNIAGAIARKEPASRIASLHSQERDQLRWGGRG